jgi:general secretion pathway protein E
MPIQLQLAQATSAGLVGWWLGLIMFAIFVPWAWLISSKLDKDAKYFHLNHVMWNGIHLGAGAAALAAMLFIPVVGLSILAGLIILAAPVLVYWKMRNQAVPEEQRFSLTDQALGEKMKARRQARATRQAALQFVDAGGTNRPMPLKEDPLFNVHMLAEDVIGPAIDSRAYRVELAVGPNGCAVSQTVDGLRYKREPIAAESALAMLDYLKDIAGLDVEDRRRRQTGKFKLKSPTGSVAIDLTTAGSSSGQIMRLDFDQSKRLVKPFDALGLLPSQMEIFKTLAEDHERHGIILVGAPPGHGLTTTAYSLISRHDAYTANIKTLEREVLLQLDGVDHVQFDPTNPDVDFATSLQSILRRDPDIVLTDEARESETAAVTVEPGMQGPLIYVQQKLPTIVDQVRQWVRLVGDVKDATKALRAVCNQRLMRTLCPNCRQSYTPSPEQIKKLNLPAERAKQLYRASGKVQVKNKIENCPICNGTGYLGQTAAFEVLFVDDEARKVLATGDLKGVLAHARRNKMIYLQEAALSKVLSGETTIEEVIRATTPQKAEGGGSAAA